jgi:hypothetical protein
VIYLFNPLPAAGLTKLLTELHASLSQQPRTIFLIYQNPILKEILKALSWLEEIDGTHQFIVFRADIRP